MVLIGGASINEYGKEEGGQPGDQNGKEVYIQDWYLHKKGWYVIRAKSAEMRKLIARDMRYACANDNIGYSFWDHAYTLYNIVKNLGWDCSKVKQKCETNCAKTVLVCAKYAGSKVEDFYTGDEVEKFRATGEFDILTDDKTCNSPDYLLEGDILVTREKGHTVVVLSDGAYAHGLPYVVANCAYANMRKGSNVNYAVIAVLKCGTKVGLLGWADNGWGRVYLNGVIGYISPMYLEEDRKEGKATGNVWLRASAGTNGKKLAIIPAGATVVLLDDKTMVGKTVWYHVQYDGLTGWASSKYIKPC